MLAPLPPVFMPFPAFARRVHAVPLAAPLVFVLSLGLLLLSYFDTLSWRKTANLALGVLLVLGLILGAMPLLRRMPTPGRGLLFGLGWSVIGGALVGALMLPVERWAKLPAIAEGGLPPADFTGLWFFYFIITLIWIGFVLILHYYDRFRQAQIRQARYAEAAREAELQAVRMQINPHFLFNCLASLRALIEREPAAARAAVDDLATTLRFALDRSTQPTIPLAAELRMVEAYLKLERLRLADRLRVIASVDPAAEALPIPPFSLQTLIENAVKFGPAARRQGGEIRYTVELGEHTLTFTVTNPGRCDAPSTSTRLGLDNLRRRLAALHGEHARLELIQAGPELVMAVMQLPLRTPAFQS